MKESVLALLRRVPLDLGQRDVANDTKGKQIALGLVPPGKGRTALDVGARAGVQTRWLQSRGYQVTSIDMEPCFSECLQVDANQRLPFADESFDLIWCSEVIEHLEDPAFAMTELRRVTKPGGTLVLTTPNSYAWLFRFIALFGLTPQRIQRKDHIQFFDLADIRRLAPDAELFGYFPYAVLKLRIQRGIGALSPTFVMAIRK
jgi:2-polyprenyl-3-methyl-5-hydroxy-6-metoxy-1,4-benzoquinol methylase